MHASLNGYSDVVNRLLECKQTDVNLQAEVGENVCTPHNPFQRYFATCFENCALHCLYSHRVMDRQC